jgi:hypothetical protein
LEGTVLNPRSRILSGCGKQMHLQTSDPPSGRSREGLWSKTKQY